MPLFRLFFGLNEDRSEQLSPSAGVSQGHGNSLENTAGEAAVAARGDRRQQDRELAPWVPRLGRARESWGLALL